MKTKNSTRNLKALFAFAVSMIFLMTLASADTLVSTEPSVLTQSTNASFTLTISGTSEWNIVSPSFPSNIEVEDSDGNKAVLRLTTSDSLTNINNTDQVRVNVSVISADSDFILSQASKTITITAQNTFNSTQLTKDVTLNFLKSYCEEGKVGNFLEISSVKDENLDNEEDWEWGPQDNIEITVRVRNHDDSDVDAVVAYGLYDFKNNEFILEDEQSVTIDSDDYEDVTLNFDMPTSDISEDTYRFYVKVYDDSEGEDTQCADVADGQIYRTIDVQRESYDVQVDEVNIPDTVPCGQPVDVKLTITNLGKHDEDKVRVTLTNVDLGLKQELVVNSLDTGDSKTLTFNFLAPASVREGKYPLKTLIEFKYDDNNEEYDESSSSSDINLNLAGSCKLTSNDVQILVDQSNAIQSGGSAGQPLVLKASIVNTGARQATFVIKATGYDSWSQLTSIEPSTVTIDAASTKDVLLYFNVNKDASETNTFKLQVQSNGETLKEQSVSVPITKKGFNITGGTIFNSSNWYLWGIGLLNVILVVLIIVIAIRVARR